MTAAAIAPKHVPQDLVHAFDVYNNEELGRELHGNLTALHHDAPDIFWTPTNNGHWMVTRYDLMDEVLKNHERFSASGNYPPYLTEFEPLIPINLDPPEHNYYRMILMRYFGPPAIKKLEPRVEYWAKTLIGAVADKGHCEFLDEVGSLFPVSIFMELMGLPLERLKEYRALVVELFGDSVTPERYGELMQEIERELFEVMDARRISPQDDMASTLQTDEVGGRRMTREELKSITNLLFQAGMDTVANFAGFFFHYLATRPELQKLIRDNPDRVGDAVEEGFRLFGVVNIGRRVREDLTLGGDLIMCMLPLGGMDERKNPDPLTFKLDRPGHDHMLFSKGAHLCIGHTLAKSEMRTFVAEWFKRIPEFRLKPGCKPTFRAGSVMGLSHVDLEWDVKPGA